MYLMTATLTEDLIGCTINVKASRYSGRRETVLADVTWLVEVPGGIDAARHAEIVSILDTQVSALSEYLRRVFPSESSRTQ